MPFAQATPEAVPSDNSAASDPGISSSALSMPDYNFDDDVPPSSLPDAQCPVCCTCAAQALCQCPPIQIPCDCRDGLLPPSEAPRIAFVIGLGAHSVMNPASPVQRAEVATMFFRLMGQQARSHYFLQSNGTNHFPDVPDSHWANNAISTLAAAGVFVGTAAGTFEPSGYMTINDFIHAAANFKGVPAGAMSQYYPPNWVGFRPENRPIERAEAVAVLMRIRGFFTYQCPLTGLQQPVEYIPINVLVDMNTWPGNEDSSQWFFWYIQAATHSHCFSYNPVTNRYQWHHLMEYIAVPPITAQQLWTFAQTMQGTAGLSEFNAMLASIHTGCHWNWESCADCNGIGYTTGCACDAPCICADTTTAPCANCECICVCQNNYDLFDLVIKAVDYDGFPVAGAAVTVSSANGDIHTGTTVSDGTVTFPSFLPGGFDVDATHPGFTHGTADGVMPNNQNGSATVTLGPPDITLTITVIGENGVPIPGAAVTVTDSEDYDHTGVTTSDGTIAFQDFLPGAYIVVATHPGSTSSGTTIGIMPETGSGAVAVTLTRPTDYHLTITVEDERDEPIPGATVTVNHANGNIYRETTDEYGLVTFESFTQGNYTLVVTHPDFDTETGYGYMPDNANASTAVVLILRYDNRLIITVEDEDGVPVPGTTVTVADQDGNEHAGITGPEGTVTFHDFPPGGFDLSAIHPDFVLGTESGFMPADTYGFALVQLESPEPPPPPPPPPTHNLIVTVVNYSGSAVPNAPVTVIDVNGNARTGTTRADGRITFHTFPVGPYNVVVSPPPGFTSGGQGASTMPAGAHGVIRITLERPPHVPQEPPPETETPEPTDPAEHVDPTDPSEPIEPTDPTYPAEPPEYYLPYYPEYLVEEGERTAHHAYLIGFDDGLVRPYGTTTRAQVATIFFRLMPDQTRAQYWSQSNSFPDVDLEQWFNNAISTVSNSGAILGLPDGTFQPNRAITRAELAAIMVRFMNVAPVEGVTQFNDISGHWASAYINAAALQGWAFGYEGIGGPFRPDQSITRAETAALINRMLNRLPGSPEDLLPGMKVWFDNLNTDAWYYLYIQEATNSHYYERSADGIHESWTQLIQPERRWELLERPYSHAWSFLTVND